MEVNIVNIRSKILLPLFVAVATAASIYPRNPANTHLLNYPIEYPASYAAVQAPFNYGVETRQGLPLPLALTQQVIFGLGNFQVQNAVTFWNLLNCLVDSTCPTVTVPESVNISDSGVPNRLFSLIQQIMNIPANNQPNIFQTFSDQLSSLWPANPPAQQNSFRSFPEIAQRYPAYYFANQFVWADFDDVSLSYTCLIYDFLCAISSTVDVSGDWKYIGQRLLLRKFGFRCLIYTRAWFAIKMDCQRGKTKIKLKRISLADVVKLV